ncbi:hypothetical protein Bbelb_215810 [Branchiostoma belcheri]|nr:hypothetical protein Bbelb_215810 [Branchiostoma belcheri]
MAPRLDTSSTRGRSVRRPSDSVENSCDPRCLVEASRGDSKRYPFNTAGAAGMTQRSTGGNTNQRARPCSVPLPVLWGPVGPVKFGDQLDTRARGLLVLAGRLAEPATPADRPVSSAIFSAIDRIVLSAVQYFLLLTGRSCQQCNLGWMTTTLAMTGKFCITASFAVIYIFSAEIFPTVVRQIGIGMSSMNARVGGMVAPFVNLLGRHWAPMPYVIFGGASIAAGLLALLLPETVGRKLPETIEEAENIGKKDAIVEEE